MKITTLAIVLAGLALPVLGSRSAPARTPPSWDIDNESLYPESPPAVGRTKRRIKKARPWWQPRSAIGVGLNFPELIPFEGYLFFGRYFGLRLFYTPPLPFNIRVEMPADVISTRRQVGVANPDFTIRLKATYGAHYGAEALVFPFGGSFFIATGVSHRSMRLIGDAKSPILVCSLIEAAKEPPCGDPAARIETQTELEIKADARTTALLTRASVGWFWDVGSWGYLMFNAGVTKPSHIRRNVKVEANLDQPSTVDEEVSGALAQVKAEREADLAEKAKNEMRPVDQKMLPILGLAAGIRF